MSVWAWVYACDGAHRSTYKRCYQLPECVGKDQRGWVLKERQLLLEVRDEGLVEVADFGQVLEHALERRGRELGRAIGALVKWSTVGLRTPTERHQGDAIRCHGDKRNYRVRSEDARDRWRYYHRLRAYAWTRAHTDARVPLKQSSSGARSRPPLATGLRTTTTSADRARAWQHPWRGCRY